MEVLLWFSPKHGLCQVWSPPDERDQIEKARLRRTESVEKRWKVWLWKQVPKSTASTCVLGFQFATRPADSSAFGVSFSARPKPKGRLENDGSATETKKGKHGETSMQMAPWQDSGFVHPLVSYMRARQGWKKDECCEVISLLWQTPPFFWGLFRFIPFCKAPGSCPDDIMLLDGFWCFVYHLNFASSWMWTARDARML